MVNGQCLTTMVPNSRWSSGQDMGLCVFGMASSKSSDYNLFSSGWCWNLTSGFTSVWWTLASGSLSWSRGFLASWSTPDIITSLIISYFSCCCGLNIPHLIRYRGVLSALASSPNECSWCGKFTDDMSPWRKTCNNFVLEIRMFHAQPSGNFNKHYTSRWGMNFHPRLWDIWKLFKGLYQVC